MYSLAVMLASRAARPALPPQIKYRPYWLNDAQWFVGVYALFNGRWQWKRSVLPRIAQNKLDRECPLTVQHKWAYRDPDRTADVWLRAMAGESA